MQSLSTVIDTSIGAGVPHFDTARAHSDSGAQLSSTEKRGVREALLEAVTQLHTSGDLARACHEFARRLQRLLKGAQVAIGMVGRSGRCQLIATSNTDSFDPRSEFVQATEAVMNHLAQYEPDVVDPVETRCLRVSGATRLLSLPLDAGLEAETETIGKLVVYANEPLDHNVLRQIDHLSPAIAANLKAIQVVQQRRGTWLATLLGVDRKSRRRAGLAVLVAVALLLLLPLPVRIACQCELQPEVRRFVPAPFSGRLDQVIAKPGDIVQQGEVLARCDRRELQWELDSLQSKRKQSRQERQSALASGKVAEAQLARLEVRSFDTKINLLKNRLAHLSIQSPVTGVVVSGDLQRAVGAPVEKGQTLFEVAPLEKMMVLVDVRERDLANVKIGQSVKLHLDGAPEQLMRGKIARIRPQSETRDGANVFVAELELSNETGALRPGMKGRATVFGGVQPLAWNFVRNAWNSLAMWIGW